MIQLSDLKIGMYLKNESSDAYELYQNGQGIISIPSGADFGQIIDFANSADGALIIFSSPEITAASPTGAKIERYILGWLGTDLAIPGAAASFAELKDVISDQQVFLQNQAFKKQDADGNTFKNEITKIASGAGEAAGSGANALLGGLGGNLWPWAIGLGFLYLASRSKTVKNL